MVYYGPGQCLEAWHSYCWPEPKARAYNNYGRLPNTDQGHNRPCCPKNIALLLLFSVKSSSSFSFWKFLNLMRLPKIFANNSVMFLWKYFIKHICKLLTLISQIILDNRIEKFKIPPQLVLCCHFKAKHFSFFYAHTILIFCMS